MLNEIDRDTILEKVFDTNPEKRREIAIKMCEFGIHCIGKHVALFETLENEARNSGLNDEAIDKLIDALNGIISPS